MCRKKGEEKAIKPCRRETEIILIERRARPGNAFLSLYAQHRNAFPTQTRKFISSKLIR